MKKEIDIDDRFTAFLEGVETFSSALENIDPKIDAARMDAALAHISRPDIKAAIATAALRLGLKPDSHIWLNVLASSQFSESHAVAMEELAAKSEEAERSLSELLSSLRSDVSIVSVTYSALKEVAAKVEASSSRMSFRPDWLTESHAPPMWHRELMDPAGPDWVRKLRTSLDAAGGRVKDDVDALRKALVTYAVAGAIGCLAVGGMAGWLAQSSSVESRVLAAGQAAKTAAAAEAQTILQANIADMDAKFQREKKEAVEAALAATRKNAPATLPSDSLPAVAPSVGALAPAVLPAATK